MLDIVYGILNADTFSYAVVIILAVFAAVVIHAATSSAGLVAFLLPGIGFCGLAGIYVSREAGVLLTRDPYTDTVLAVVAGMLVGLLVMLILMRAVFAVMGHGVAERPAGRSPYRL